jgi:sugar diacid utilization regulator
VTDLQGLVDALAATIGGPVEVDDRQFRAIAHSSHPDGIDPVRLRSILQRETPPAVTTWLESLGVRDVSECLRVPANATFSMASRVCVPIRFDGTLLGYIWLIDEPELSAPQLEAACDYADELGAVLYRARRLEHEEREREQALVRELVGSDTGNPRSAGDALVGGGYLPSAPFYAALVLVPKHEDGRPAPDAIHVRLAAATEGVRRRLAPRHMLVLATREQELALLAAETHDELEQGARTLIDAARTALRDCPGWSPLLGVGGARATASELGCSHAEAQHAVRLGRAATGLGPLVRWDAIGAYRTVARLADGRDVSAALPASLVRLLECPGGDALVQTLEAYLEHAGDARAASAALFLHRSSLYQRLRRIEEVAGVDLHCGDDRLDLHLGLRLWHMRADGFPSR